MKRLKNIWEYIKDRAGEPSTWRGIVLLLTVCGTQIDADQAELIITLGLGATGLLGAAFPDKKKKSDNE